MVATRNRRIKIDDFISNDLIVTAITIHTDTTTSEDVVADEVSLTMIRNVDTSSSIDHVTDDDVVGSIPPQLNTAVYESVSCDCRTVTDIDVCLPYRVPDNRDSAAGIAICVNTTGV
jgi:hypothetical protein